MNVQKTIKMNFSIALDEDVIRQIRKLAEADDRNFSQYIIIILKRHVQQNAYRGKQKKEKSSSTD